VERERVGVVGIWGNFVIGDLEGMKGTEEMKNHGDKLVVLASPRRRRGNRLLLHVT
jgi:hypothetical protein